jgi:putative chitinase
MKVTESLLKKCLPSAKSADIAKFVEPLNATFDKYAINTPERIAAFLAQIAHESGSFKYVRELADGSAYEGRKDLGNTQPGDGKKFKGRGLIQVTGRTNYKAVSTSFGVDFIQAPERLEEPLYATLSAGWFWFNRGLNTYADQNDFLMISKRINGVNKKTGFPNGWEDRQKHWEICKNALNILE